MSIIGYLTAISLFSGVQFILTVIFPVFVALVAAVYVFDRVVLMLDRGRRVVYQAAIDYLEWMARLDNLRDDHARRELAIAEAGLSLRARRLELQGKRLELLDTAGELER